MLNQSTKASFGHSLKSFFLY